MPSNIQNNFTLKDHVTKNPCLLKKKYSLYESRSHICLSQSTLNSQCMQSVGFCSTVRLWTRAEAYVICIPLKNTTACRNCALCIRTVGEFEHGYHLLGQVAQLPASAQVFTTVCLRMLYPLKLQMLCLIRLFIRHSKITC